mmetsp:Transcript_52535/g.47163  ORF Transcript_52535/g.47163 Transcript_52535/m.47163 type:complete len:124 (+) Transcript_52535:2-373(+)
MMGNLRRFGKKIGLIADNHQNKPAKGKGKGGGNRRNQRDMEETDSDSDDVDMEHANIMKALKSAFSGKQAKKVDKLFKVFEENEITDQILSSLNKQQLESVCNKDLKMKVGDRISFIQEWNKL